MTHESDKTPHAISFHILKSSQFRVLFADGVIGGITPRGLIQMGFFNERHPFPTQTTHRLEGNRLGTEVLEERISREGIVREIDVAVTMDLVAARNLIDWLKEKVDELEKFKAGT